jgi:hypothetical protein
MVDDGIIKPCKLNCGQMVYHKSQLKCEKCKKHKFWFIDFDKYNINEEDPRKKLKKCECGHYYILWNQYQHTQSKHHKQYIIDRDNLEIKIENPARLCTKKDGNNKIHGRWSINYHDTCPKCPPKKPDTIIQTKNADVYIFHNNKI